MADAANDFATLTGGPTLHNVDPQPDANPYAAIIAEPVHAANVAIAGTAAGNPDTAANNNELSRQTGLPTDVVAAAPDAVKAQVRTVQARSAVAGNPALANWSANPSNAAVAHDDYPILTKIGNVVANLGRSIAAAVPQFNAGVYGLLQAASEVRDPINLAVDAIFGTKPPPNPVASFFAARRAESLAAARDWAPKETNPYLRGLYSGITNLPTAVAAIAATAAGMPEVGAALFAAPQAGQSYGDARDAGVTPGNAAVYGAAQGAVALTTELPAFNYAASALGKTGVGKFIAGFLGRDLAGTEAQTLGSNLLQWSTLTPHKTPQQFLDEQPEAIKEAAGAALAMSGLVGAGHVAARAFDMTTHATVLATRAKQDAAFLDDLANGVDTSLTRRRDPTAFEQFLQGQAEGTPVDKLYVPADKVRELYQGQPFAPGAEDDKLFGFQPDIAEQLRQAEPSGGDVVLDTSKAMTHLPGTPTWDAIKPDVRVRPDGLSMRDVIDHSAAFDDAMRASGEAAAAEAKAAAENDAPRQQVFDDVHAQAKAAGFGTNAARAYAELFAARYQARGEALGTDALSAYRASDVSIRQDGMEPVEHPPVEPARTATPAAEPAVEPAPNAEAPALNQGANDVPPEPGEPFDPLPHLNGAVSYLRDRKAGPLTGAALGKRLGLTPEQGQAVLGKLASSGHARGLMTLGAKGVPRRTIQRKGPVDLLTQVADMGGIKDNEGHDLARGRGLRRMISGAGPLIRKNGLTIDQLGLRLTEEGWFRERPTTADVLDLLDKAARNKVYHPHEQHLVGHDEAGADDGAHPEAIDHVEAAAQEMGVALPKADIEHIALYHLNSTDGRAAIEDYANRQFEEAAHEAAATRGDGDYEDFLLEEDHGDTGPEDGAGGEDRGGPEGPPVDGGKGAEGAGDLSGDRHDGSLGLDAAQASREGLTDAQRTEMEARLQQSRMGRLDQQSVDQIDGGLFDAKRDQRTLFQPPVGVGDQYRNQLAALQAGTMPRGEVLRLGKPSEILRGAGVPDREIIYRQSTALKTLTGKHAETVAHEVVARLPEMLADPVLVYKQPDGRVVAVLKATPGADVISVIDIDVKTGGPVANVIVSTHSKERDDAIRSAIADNRVTYRDEARSQRWFEQVPNRTGESTTPGRTREVLSIATKRNLLQDSRGSISFGIRSQIRLFEGRDLSTLLHEGGHLFLEELKFDAAGSNPQVKADYAAVTKWFADNGHAVDEDGEIPTEAHELFARAFERYLMDGKPPSSGLARAFATFRSWLLRIYQVVGNLGAPITPEVRGVMDRLLATQSEIDAATAADNNRLLFRDAAQAGMTDAEFAAYTGTVTDARAAAMDALLYRTMETVRRARTKEWQEERARVRSGVAEGVRARPEFQALDLMRSRDKEQRTPLDRQALIDQFGPDVLKDIPGGVPPTVVEGGVHPDILAERVGLPTGEELVKRLTAVKREGEALKAANDKRSPREKAIDNATDAVMAERHGDPFTDGSIEAEARAAIHNDVRSALIASEARALARKTGRTATPYSVARDWANRQVRGAPVRDAVSAAALQRHQRAYNKAAAAAEKALAAGDIDETFRQKQAQMLSDALFRETKAAKDEVETAAKRLSKLAAAKTLKSMDQDYLDRIHGLLEAYDFKQRSGPAIDERAAFAKFVEQQSALGNEVYVPPRLLDADATNYRSMTTDDLLGLDDAVQSLATLGRQKKKLLVAKEERDFDEIVGTAVAAAEPLPDRKFSSDRNPKPKLFGRIAAELTRVEFMADELDGFDPNGPFNRILVQGATEAANARDRLKREVLDPLATLYHDLADKSRLQERIAVPEFPTTHADGSSEPTVFRRMDLLAVALNTGSESNLDKMSRGEGWHPDTIQAVLDRELNADDWRFVEKAWRQVDSLWPEIARVERELSGVVPEKIEPRTVTTPHGEVQGGYWPVVYDPLRSDFAAKLYDGDADSMFGQIGRTASTPKGHTIERTDAAYPLNLSLEGVLLNHVNRVTTRIAYGRYVRDTLKFISDPRIRNVIDAKRGIEDYNRLRPWLQGQVNDAKMDTASLKGLDNILKQSRINATVVGLGLRVTTMIQHVSYLANSSKEIGPDWMLKGIRAAVANVGRNADFVYSRSEEMAHRSETFDQNVRDAFAQMGTRYTGKAVHDAAVRAQEFAQHMAFWGMGKFLVHGVGIPTWLGAYQRGLAEGMSETDAAHYGDKVVRRAQGGGRPKDLSGFQQGSEAMRQLGMFYSYFGTLYNQQREAMRGLTRAVAGDNRGGDYRRAAMTAFWIATVEPLVVSLVKGDLPKDGEDWGAWALKKLFFGLWGGLPVIRDAASGLEHALQGQPFSGTEIPAARAMKSVYDVTKDAVHAARGDQPSDRWLQHAIETPGYFLGLPTGQPAATAQYLHDVHDGTQRPKGAGDVVAGVLHGHEKRQE